MVFSQSSVGFIMFYDLLQLITALVSIRSSMTFLADMYSFLDPPSRTVLFSISWVMPTTAFLMRQLIVAPRLGSDEIETSK